MGFGNFTGPFHARSSRYVSLRRNKHDLLTTCVGCHVPRKPRSHSSDFSTALQLRPRRLSHAHQNRLLAFCSRKLLYDDLRGKRETRELPVSCKRRLSAASLQNLMKPRLVLRWHLVPHLSIRPNCRLIVNRTMMLVRCNHSPPVLRGGVSGLSQLRAMQIVHAVKHCVILSGGCAESGDGDSSPVSSKSDAPF